MESTKSIDSMSVNLSQSTNSLNSSNSSNSTISLSGNAIVKKEKQVKQSKDPNAPRRPLTAYFLFAAEIRSKIKADNPTITSASEIAKLIGAKWAAMDEGEKQKYNDLAFIERSEYAKAKEAYENKNKQSSTTISTPTNK